jgi:hypothetical protein
MRIRPGTQIPPGCRIILRGAVAAAILAVICQAAGCSVSSRMMTHLSDTIVNSDDPAMVEAGAPAYLLMIDSLISREPDSRQMLSAGALLYTAYADLFVTDEIRSGKIAGKALAYASQAVCLSDRQACGLTEMPYDAVTAAVDRLDRHSLPALFALGAAWSGWIMANRSDFNALADISRIEVIMTRVVQLDESFRDGAAFLYLATLATFMPPALGGKPEAGKAHFEKAIHLSRGKNLMAKVLYAKLYARMMFDRDLHDRLLNEVLAADPYQEGYTLVNIHARDQARQLLAAADDFF